jgi:hypothetical protein
MSIIPFSRHNQSSLEHEVVAPGVHVTEAAELSGLFLKQLLESLLESGSEPTHLGAYAACKEAKM